MDGLALRGRPPWVLAVALAREARKCEEPAGASAARVHAASTALADSSMLAVEAACRKKKFVTPSQASPRP
eukprot:3393397-Alexandrium_andersonii.AAC.1